MRRALKGVGIADPENLDTHSLRRAWITTATRQGVPTALAMRVTGHKELKVFHGYQRNAVGDDLTGAVHAVHQARKRAGEAGRKNQPPQIECPASPELVGAASRSNGLGADQLFTS